MGTATAETERTLALFKQIEVLEDVATRVPEPDRALLAQVVKDHLDTAAPTRVIAAAQVLDVSEKTVRSWVKEGVLTPASDTGAPRLLLDTQVLHSVFHVVQEIRAAGQSGPLLDEVYRRLVDATWLERPDLATSIGQMHRGEGVVRVPKTG